MSLKHNFPISIERKETKIKKYLGHIFNSSDKIYSHPSSQICHNTHIDGPNQPTPPPNPISPSEPQNPIKLRPQTIINHNNDPSKL
ncbi:hypothetical protein WN51_01597 [Melipona quadrifasciata]|uniref:Uncharacterized protein n=1 Tax=Melipona quadrifasciata TaxID=166423 RepID=A0A0N0U4E4_9HYME|nr:hypothetical protein WN51_01597 [Melipona quadrifasciata]